MTSTQTHMVPIGSIWINRDKRQRRELKDVELLADSIRQVGLINFPVITRQHELIAGERRLEAMRLLHWTEVPIHYTDEIDRDRLHLIELEENAKRLNLTWQDHNRAIVEYHALRAEADPSWTQEKTAEAMGISPPMMTTHMQIAEAAKTSPALKIYEADVFSTAKGLATRALERRASTGMAELLGPTPEPEPQIETLEGEPIVQPAPAKRALILNTTFQEFLSHEHPRFNFIHCDFPYGVDTGSKTTGQSATKRLGSYADEPDVYWDLLDFLCARTAALCEPQAHLMFWFSMRFYHETVTRLEAAGWKIDPFPLIWGKSDNSGIIPDSNRGPRRGYEPCLFGSLGDRKIVRPVSNFISCSNPREVHAHQKPQEALQHFMRMFVDGSTRMLDPTCGSGSAVKAAEALGADMMIGLERDPEFAERAKAFVAA